MWVWHPLAAGTARAEQGDFLGKHSQHSTGVASRGYGIGETPWEKQGHSEWGLEQPGLPDAALLVAGGGTR